MATVTAATAVTLATATSTGIVSTAAARLGRQFRLRHQTSTVKRITKPTSRYRRVAGSPRIVGGGLNPLFRKGHRLTHRNLRWPLLNRAHDYDAGLTDDMLKSEIRMGGIAVRANQSFHSRHRARSVVPTSATRRIRSM